MNRNRSFKFHTNLLRSHASYYGILFVAGILLFGILSPQAFADVQRFSNFQYDGAGNIVRISSIDQSSPPNVVNIDPGFINIGQTVNITATGTDLLAAQVATTASGLSIFNVNTTQTLVTFDITAEQNAVPGSVIITFTTGVGSDDKSIVIAETVPGLITNPNPITIAANGQPSLIQLLFTQPRPTQEIYTLSIADPLIATASVTSVIVPAGATTAEFELSGITLGTTILNVALLEKFFFSSFPVFVSENFVADSDISSRPIGVFLSTDAQGIDNPLLSQSVGVFVQTDAQGIENPLLSQPVGVFLQTDVQGIDNPLLSQPVGVFVQTDVQGIDNPLLSQAVGVFTGPVISSYSPALLEPGIQTDILFSGAGLDEVTGISIEPAGVIAVDGFLSAPDGTALTVTVSVDPTAAAGDYQMIITSVSGEVTLSQGVRAILSIP